MYIVKHFFSILNEFQQICVDIKAVSVVKQNYDMSDIVIDDTMRRHVFLHAVLT